MVRGVQIAEYLSCRLNAPIDAEDTVVCVKCVPDADAAKKAGKTYLDFVDDAQMEKIYRDRPYAKAIVSTPALKDFLSGRITNPIVVIPPQTCNFEHQARKRQDVSIVGYVGHPQCFWLNLEDVKARLAGYGLDFKYLLIEDSTSRRQVCDFYMGIDIQIAFRPDHPLRPPVFRSPLKIINAGSFGIPTVAYPEFAYRNAAKSMYLEAVDFEDLVRSCVALRDDARLYEWYSSRSHEFSKDFTIDKIAGLYKKLEE